MGIHFDSIRFDSTADDDDDDVGGASGASGASGDGARDLARGMRARGDAPCARRGRARDDGFGRRRR